MPLPLSGERWCEAFGLQVHRLQAQSCQIFVTLAAGIASDADTTQNHAVFHNHKPALTMRQIGISQLADTSPLAVQALCMRSRVLADNGGRVRLPERMTTTEQPEIVHLEVSYEVSCIVY